MQILGTANFNDFCPQFLSPVLSPICLFLSQVRSLGTIGDKLETIWRQENVNDSDKGLSEKLL